MHLLFLLSGLIALASAGPFPIDSYSPTTTAKSAAVDDISAYPLAKRTEAACASQSPGYGPRPTPDTASAFLNFNTLSSIASAAPVPVGFKLAFTNLRASSSSNGYLGYTTLKTYHPEFCAAKCHSVAGCSSFNIFFERYPLLKPGPSCPNPASTTTIKCLFWKGFVSTSNAVNTGSWHNNFHIVIAGSNGYSVTALPALPLYSQFNDLGSNAINLTTRSTTSIPTTSTTLATTLSTTAITTTPSSFSSTLTTITTTVSTTMFTTTGSVTTSSSASSTTTSSTTDSTTTSTTTSTTDFTPTTTTTTTPTITTTTTTTLPITTSIPTTTTVPTTTTTLATTTVPTTTTTTTTTIPATTTTTTSAAIPTYSGFVNSGCYNSNFLTSKQFTTNNNSLEFCSNFCTGYTYMSVENGNGCACAFNSTGNPGTPASGGCSTPCASDSTEICGGFGHNNIYMNSAYSNSAPAPQQLAPADQIKVYGFTEQGCFSGGYLGGPSISTSNMTIQYCASLCVGYTYMSVENGNQCSCGNTVTGSPVTPNSGGCGTSCAANSSQICGGFGRNNLYMYTAPTYSGYASKGCKSGGSLNGSSIITNAVSLEYCASYCTGYQYFSVQNGNQCSCGQTTGGNSATFASGQCTTSCAANSSEICGGSGYSNLYKNPNPGSLPTYSGFVQQGCFSGGLLTSKSISSSNNSLEYCSSFCTGYTYMSVQNGTQCSCAFDVSGNASTPASGCTTPCSGNNNESCGGTNLNNLFMNANNSNPYPAPQQLTSADQIQIGNFVEQGCFGGDFPFINRYTNSSMTLESCAAFCTEYPYMSLDTGNDCTCGNSWNTTVAGGIPKSGCTLACSGNSSEICGGYGRNTLYQNINSNNKTVGQFLPLGCFGGGFPFTNRFTNNSNNWETCAAFCTGYPYMSIDNGNDCMCGNSMNATAAGGTHSTGCFTSCPGNSSELCGGPGTNSVFQNFNSSIPTVGQFRGVGCFGGGFPFVTRYTNSSNTWEMCSAFCTGYPYMSIDNGNDCMCGNSMNGTAAGGTLQGGCFTSCPGNSSEVCGGPGYNNLFKNVNF